MFPGRTRPSRASRVFIYARARACLSALALLAGLLAAPAHAAPPAGTLIDNTASGTVTFSAGGGGLTQPSNSVRAVVQAAETLALYPDRGGIAGPGGSVTLAHRLVNRGNGSSDIRLDAGNLPLDGFDATSFALLHDRDRDGRAGVGDTPIANGGVLTLAAGDSADVLFTLGVAASAPMGSLAFVRLSATGLAQGATALVTDTLRVDEVGAIALFAEQAASRPEVEWGDVLEWTIRVANRSDVALAAVRITEQLPFGLAYVRGSARSTAGAIADSAGSGGSAPAFSLRGLGPRESLELRFATRVQSGAPAGEARAVAQAFGTTSGSGGPCGPAGCGVSGAETASNAAPATTRVRGDLFADVGGIVGSVSLRFSPLIPSAAPPPEVPADGPTVGLPGVRLYLDDGTWAVSDAQGRFSFTAVTPRTHALKLDRTTLPQGAFPVSVDHRDQGTPGLRFVDLTRGDLARADFLIIADTAAAGEVMDRVLAAGGRDERARVVAYSIQRPEQRALPGDARSLPSAAIITGERETGAGPPRRAPQAPTAPPAGRAPAAAAPDTGISPVPLADMESNVLPSPAAPAVPRPPLPGVAPSSSIEQLLSTLDPELGFIGLADMDTLASAQLTVRVKGPLGTPLRLRLNGERVPESRIGRRVSASTAKLEAWEYVGITLDPGVNLLELAPPQSPGRVAVRVVAPGALARLWLTGPGAVPADGHSESWYTLTVTDSAGVPVGARTLVTLEATRGYVPLEDLDPASPGLQLAVEGGRARVPVMSPTSPGRAELTATSGAMRAVADMEFVPELRPLLVVGTVEGAVGVAAVRAPASGRTPREGFEQPLGEFLSESQDGSKTAGARAALYVKGRVRSDMELTLGYDSDRPDDLRQFRDLQVDRGYPVQGDASVRGYDAQSTGKLYGRLERRDASLLYGDLITGGSDLSLANYARSLTGAVVSWDGDAAPGGVRSGTSGRLFTSRDRSHQVIDELPGRGVSGPYRLARAPLVENSERVEVLVRDRDQPAVVISAELRQRFTDYALDPLSGELVFRSPVPSFDAELNPVSVRVTYEIEDATGAAWVSGLQLRQRVGPNLTLGGTYVDDHDPAQPFELRGASALARLAPRTTLAGEWAVTHTLAGAVGTGPASGGSSGRLAGDAGRLELRHDDPRTQARAWAMAAAAGFANPGAGLAGGHTEAGGRLSTRLAERTRLTSEALYSADAAGGTKRGGVFVSVDRTLNAAWRGELGMRVAGESNASLPEEPLEATVRLKLLGQWPSHPEWSGYGEYEQDTQIASRRLAALGGEYRFSARGRVYARHELASSLTGAWALSERQQRLATVAGVDADLARDAHVFSEYRLADALAGREAQAAVGLRNAWRLRSGIRVGGTFERVNPLSGAPAREGPSTALSGSLDWAQDPRWKGSLRLEGRTSRETDQVLQSMAAAVKLDSSWTGLVRHQFTTGGSRRAGTRDADERFQVAFAYRDPGGAGRPAGTWDALGRWDFIYDRSPGLLDGGGSGLSSRHIANVVGLNGTGRIATGTSASLAWAGKLTREQGGAGITRGLAQWLHGRLMRDIGQDWDVSVTGSVRTGASFADRQYGMGLEVGRQLPGGMWISAGFNRFGYRDDELTAEEWTRTGGFLRLRARFDESLFRRTGGQP